MARAGGRSRRRRRWLVAAGVGLTGVAVAGFLVWRAYRDTSTEVDVEAVVSEFRAATTTGAPPTGAPRTIASTDPAPVAPTNPAAVPRRLPEPGVYVYATTGRESVDALGGTDHDYPAETTITVLRGGCGVLLRWVALEERTEEWDLCLDPGGDLVGTYYESYHRFFGRDDRRRYECGQSTLLPARVTGGASWGRTCDGGDRTEVVRLEVIGVEPVTVGGDAVDSVHLRVATELSATDGTTSESHGELWLHPQTGLPLRQTDRTATTSPQVIGDVHYEEQYELVLTSLEPHR
jgi:hypothetical protein